MSLWLTYVQLLRRKSQPYLCVAKSVEWVAGARLLQSRHALCAVCQVTHHELRDRDTASSES